MAAIPQGVIVGACNYNLNNITCIQKGAILAPWVSVTIIASGVTITIGNESSPANRNTAIIKDFEFGHSNGFNCRFTIFDEQGGSFVRFIEHLMKNFKCVTPAAGYQAVMKFGWISTECDGSSNITKSVPYYLLLSKLHCSYNTDGKFIYEVECTDLLEPSFQGLHSTVYGGDAFKNATSLQEAIRLMFTDPGPDKKYTPVVKSVRFLRPGQINKTADCINKFNEPEVIEFEDKDFKSKFPGNNLSKIDIALKWTADFLTDKKKTLVPMYNAEVEGGELIFWETLRPDAGQAINPDDYSIGTFVVNGGPKSNVLQFTPKFHWNFTALSNPSGNIGVNPKFGDKANANDKFNTIDFRAIPGVGTLLTLPFNERVIERDPPGNKEKMAEARQKQILAMQPYRINATSPIEAEMVIIGDPSLSRPALCMERPLHVIFLNPYHFFGGESFKNRELVSCGEWYVLGPFGCNPIYTNKGWRIKGIVHKISGGKYTTTFTLWLPAPGIDLDIGSPLGGENSGGWQPPIDC